MTLLGQFALWAALPPRPLGRAIGFSGRWQDRPELAATVVALGLRRAAAASWWPSLALWKGLISHDFNIEYVAAYTSRNLPPYYIFSAFWAGQKGSLLFWAVVLSIFASLAQLLTPRRYADLLPYVAGVTSAVVAFFVSVMLFGSNPFERLAFTPADGRGLNPQLQNVGHGDPPADALPGLHQHHHPVRLRHRRAALPAARHRLDPRHPEVDAGDLALPLDRDHARHVVGLRRAGLGRLLGVGSGGERELPAVAHDDRVPAFGDDPGEARHAQALEPGAHHRHVPAQHLRHVHHPLGRDRERAQLHPVERRLLLPGVPAGGRRAVVHAALHPLAAARGRGRSSSRW